MNLTSDRKLTSNQFQELSKEYYSDNGHSIKIYSKPETEHKVSIEQKTLELNGIQTSPMSSNRLRKKYKVFLCHHVCFALLQLKNSRGSAQPLLLAEKGSRQHWVFVNLEVESKELNKVIKLAHRALYVLGFDMGVVEISIFRQEPKYVVTRLSNEEFAYKKYEGLAQAALGKMLKELEGIVPNEKTVLGADLEFVLRNSNGQYVLASRYFSKFGRVGYDSVPLIGRRNRYPLVELRPAPSETPRGLAINIYKCMQQAAKVINNHQIEWLAGGEPLSKYPIGGHLHFSQIPLTMKFIRILDNYLTLPLFILESKESIQRRPRYGFIGDFRRQFHGGFEYRTPPSWIVTPTITKGVLALAKLLSIEYPNLSWLPFQRYEVQEAFYHGDQNYLLPIVKQLWSELRSLSTYKKYKQYLDAFYRLIERGERWNEYADIRKPWRLPPFHRTT